MPSSTTPGPVRVPLWGFLHTQLSGDTPAAPHLNLTPNSLPHCTQGRGVLQERDLAGGNRQNFHLEHPKATLILSKSHQNLKLEDLQCTQNSKGTTMCVYLYVCASLLFK